MNKSSYKMLTPLTVSVLVALSGTLFPAFGQDQVPSTPAVKQDQKPAATPLPPDPLRGPKVEDAGVPGESRRFGGPSKDRRDRAEPAIPHRAFVRALENMQNSNPDGSLKFNTEQRQYVKKIEDELKSDVQEFVNLHRDEIAALPPEVLNRIRLATGVTVQLPAAAKAKAKPKTPAKDESPTPMDSSDSMRDGGGGGGMMDQDSMTDGTMTDGSRTKDKAEGIPPRELARVLIEKAPKPADYHARVWQVLSVPQRDALKLELTKYREQAAGRNGNVKPGTAKPTETKAAESKAAESKSDAKQREESMKKGDSKKGKESEKKAAESNEKSKAKRGGAGNDKQPDLDSFRGKDGKIDINKLPPRVRERLQNLSEEERERALKELEKQRNKNK